MQAKQDLSSFIPMSFPMWLNFAEHRQPGISFSVAYSISAFILPEMSKLGNVNAFIPQDTFIPSSKHSYENLTSSLVKEIFLLAKDVLSRLFNGRHTRSLAALFLSRNDDQHLLLTRPVTDQMIALPSYCCCSYFKNDHIFTWNKCGGYRLVQQVFYIGKKVKV